MKLLFNQWKTSSHHIYTAQKSSNANWPSFKTSRQKTLCEVETQTWADHWVGTEVRQEMVASLGCLESDLFCLKCMMWEWIGGSGGPRGHCERVCRMCSHWYRWGEFFMMQSPVFGQVAGEELTSLRMMVLFVPQLKRLCLIKGLLRG